MGQHAGLDDWSDGGSNGADRRHTQRQSRDGSSDRGRLCSSDQPSLRPLEAFRGRQPGRRSGWMVFYRETLSEIGEMASDLVAEAKAETRTGDAP